MTSHTDYTTQARVTCHNTIRGLNRHTIVVDELADFRPVGTLGSMVAWVAETYGSDPTAAMASATMRMVEMGTYSPQDAGLV
jgi:hypothetical protein